MEEMIVPNTCSSSATAAITTNNKPSSTSLERKVRPQKEQAVNCPRCNSINTKFCYYNNYSLTQPRYFCKSCRRYWTQGGSLRNIPVGGGSRKNRRSSSSSFTSSSKKLPHDLIATTQSHHLNPNPNHKIHPQGQDLNLGFPPTHQEFRSLSEFIQLPTIEPTTSPKAQIPTANHQQHHDHHHHHHHHLSALELLNGLTSSRILTPFMPMPVPDPNAIYSSGFPSLQNFKPTLNFSLDGLGNGYGGSLQQAAAETTTTTTNNNNGRILFPFEEVKQVSSTTSADHDNSTTANEPNREQGDSTGYWSGMLGTGGSW